MTRNRLPLFILSLLIATTLLGCTTTRTYDLRVENKTSGPVTLWLTKNGPPAERGWEPPEALAQRNIRDDEAITGVIVPPRGIASTKPLKGKFYSDTGALLRVYVGERKFADILAIGRDSPNRYDFNLAPGHNDLTIIDSAGSVRVVRRTSLTSDAK